MSLMPAPPRDRQSMGPRGGLSIERRDGWCMGLRCRRQLRGESGLFQAISLADPSSPYVAGEVLDLIQSGRVAIRGTYAYVADGTLRLIDIRNPAARPLSVPLARPIYLARSRLTTGGHS